MIFIFGGGGWEGGGSVTLKSRGWSKKTKELTGSKNKGDSLAAGTYTFKESLPTPPPRGP